MFGLAGGVTEYGGALVCDGEATGLLPPDGRALLALLDLRANGLASVPVSTTAAYRWLARRTR